MDVLYEGSLSSTFGTRRLKSTSNTAYGFLTYSKNKEHPANARETSTEEFLAFAHQVGVSPASVAKYSRRTSLVEDEASLQDLQAQFAAQNAILLSVAVLGAAILLLTNLIGILFCKGYFRRKAVVVSTNTTASPQSLSRMRSNRYSNILQRFSRDYQQYNHRAQEPQTSSASVTAVIVECKYRPPQESSHTGCRLCNANSSLALPLVDNHDAHMKSDRVTHDFKRSYRMRSLMGGERNSWHKCSSPPCASGEGMEMSDVRVSGRSQAVCTSVGDNRGKVRKNLNLSEEANVEVYPASLSDVEETCSSYTLSLSVPSPVTEISSV